MQTRSRQYAVVASVALTMVLAACSSSTSPKQITPAQLAEHFDSIYSADLAAGTGLDSNAARNVAELVEVAAAYGGGEASVTVTTASGTQSWKGVGFIFLGTSDTEYVSALYPNRDLQQVVISLVDMSGGVADGFAAASVDGLASGPNDSTITGETASLLSTGATCSQQSGLAAASVLTGFVGTSVACTLAKFQVSFSAVFPAAAGLGALESVSVTNATIIGPMFASTGSHVVAIPSKGAALALRLRAQMLDSRH
jgi:hypothetical protein